MIGLQRIEKRTVWILLGHDVVQYRRGQSTS